MAKKRRTKKRKASAAGAHLSQDNENDNMQSQPASPTHGGSQHGLGDRAIARSSLLSTEGKSSEGRESSEMEEGTYTEMTSAVSSDGHEEANLTSVLRARRYQRNQQHPHHEYNDEGEDEDGDDTSEGRSMYGGAPSHYPTMATKHRVEMPYGTENDQDVDMLSTRSITEQDLDYRWEHGRRYCGPHYFMPNDDYEQIRLSLVHRIFIDIFEGKLTSTPLDDPELILDVGTGIGEWAIGMADMYPDCEVIGTDISAIQPTSVPTNCFFEVDDAELEWTREPDSFDLIHLRNMLGCFADWHLIYDEAFRALKPGGWIELIDFDESNGGLSGFVSQFPPDSDIHQLFPNYLKAVEKSGRVRGLAHMNPSWLNRAGFVDIKVTDHVIPIDNEAGGGRLWLISCIDGLEAMCLRTMTQYADWSADRVKEACFNVAKEMAHFAKDPVKAKGLTMNVRVVVGRKPLVPESGERSPVAPCSGAEHDAGHPAKGQSPMS